MDLNPIVLAIPIYFLLIGIELLVQKFTSRKLYRMNDAIANISCGITQQLTGLFFKIFSIGIYQIVFENFAIFVIPSNWISLVVLFIAVDFFYYWAHRKSHEINLFWGGHVVHHQSEDYNFSVALRQSSFQVIWTFAFYLPLAILGFNTLDFVLMAGLTTVYQFWIHTETIKKLGPLEYIFNTPSHHRVHHGRDPKYIDKNHAGVFIIWDKIFGTFQEEEEKPTYGITRPVNSWNPVWANIDHYTVMFKELKSIKTFTNRINYLFNRPGWLPENLGGYRAPKVVDQNTFEKYNFDSGSKIHYYVLFQYALVLLGTAVFLFNASAFSLFEKSLITLAITVTIVNCGGLFENRSWIRVSEQVRITVFSLISVYLSYISGWSYPLLVGGMTYFIFSTYWLTLLLPRELHATKTD